MGFLDKFLDIMRLNDDEYEFDNEEYEFEEEEVPAKENKFAAKRERKKESAPDNSRMTEEKPSKPMNKITPISRNRKQGQQTGMEVCVIQPKGIEEEIEIVQTLLNGRTVVLNMEGLNIDIAQRIIDFTSGATYAMQGNLQKITNYIFIVTPNGVDISGDITNLMESFDLPGFSV